MYGLPFFHTRHHCLPSCASAVSFGSHCLNIFLPVLPSTVSIATKDRTVRK
jgi:hypothetical protein